MDRPVYVITDAAPPRGSQTREALAELLSPTGLAALVAVPLWAVVSIPLGMLLGWHPLLLFGAVVIGSPVLINLTDLLAARLGLPPLAWLASLALGLHRSKALTVKENDV